MKYLRRVGPEYQMMLYRRHTKIGNEFVGQIVTSCTGRQDFRDDQGFGNGDRITRQWLSAVHHCIRFEVVIVDLDGHSIRIGVTG